MVPEDDPLNWSSGVIPHKLLQKGIEGELKPIKNRNDVCILSFHYYRSGICTFELDPPPFG